jgi:hypothetical protein
VSRHSLWSDDAHATNCPSVLSEELGNFETIQDQSRLHNFLVQEEDKQKIVEIFERVKEARQNMIVSAFEWLLIAKADVSCLS